MRKRKNKIFSIVVLLISMSFSATAATPSVIYEGNSKVLVAAPDDFFAEFQEMMPGDSITETVTLSNTEDEPVEFYFRTDISGELKELIINGDYEVSPEDELSRSASLLEEIELNIQLKNSYNNTQQELYNGNLAAMQLEDFISLGNYAAGFDGEFEFSLYVPRELGNVYALSNTEVDWIFGVKEPTTPDEPDNPTTPDEPDNPTTPNEPDNPTTPNEPNGPATSDTPDEPTRRPSVNQILGIEDHTKIIAIGCILLGSTGIGYLIYKKRKGVHINEK